ncbi:LOW QUALITY PROTEIN: hypothetical protein GQ55_9G638600 [Panicum hallii var. hallii]|uniref:Myb/SANT-like domain-containing protein n=1 Tax=Panicum hallii var. hallii TaxID=1504633 RepID=A0A2T7CIH2_9POAL|nr:LOW QUALITY PROTEIN: hypothetical protein GQ55_9G638600 [Panicum hallii var. hallii]
MPWHASPFNRLLPLSWLTLARRLERQPGDASPAQNCTAETGSVRKLSSTSTKSEPASANRTRSRKLSTASLILMPAIARSALSASGPYGCRLLQYEIQIEVQETMSAASARPPPRGTPAARRLTPPPGARPRRPAPPPPDPAARPRRPPPDLSARRPTPPPGASAAPRPTPPLPPDPAARPRRPPPDPAARRLHRPAPDLADAASARPQPPAPDPAAMPASADPAATARLRLSLTPTPSPPPPAHLLGLRLRRPQKQDRRWPDLGLTGPGMSSPSPNRTPLTRDLISTPMTRPGRRSLAWKVSPSTRSRKGGPTWRGTKAWCSLTAGAEATAARGPFVPLHRPVAQEARSAQLAFANHAVQVCHPAAAEVVGCHLPRLLPVILLVLGTGPATGPSWRMTRACRRSFRYRDGLRHDTKQLSGRIRTLKQMYGFIKDMHTDSGLGRDDQGWSTASKDWWDTKIKGCPEFKKLKWRPPEYFDLLEHCFHDVAVDGSSEFVPGQEEDEALYEDEAQGNEEEEEELQGTENSPMSSSGHKRARSTSTRSTADSPIKKSKSPMLKVMKQYLHMSTRQSAERNLFLKKLGNKQENAEAKLEAAIKKAQQLAKQAGLDESSPEFYAVSHICKDEALMKFFINMETSEGRVAFLRRYCKEKKSRLVYHIDVIIVCANHVCHWTFVCLLYLC